MAQFRSRRKRRIAQLTLFTLLVAALSSCVSAGSSGWFVADESAPIDSLVVSTDSRELTVTVELPPGYEAAAEFTQRATLGGGESPQSDTQTYLDRPFRLAVPTDVEGVELQVMIGFCQADIKEVCYIDTATLRISRAPDSRRRAPEVLALRYRPEEPR